MKNTILTLLFIAAAALLGRAGLPWWSPAPAALLAGWLLPLPAGRGFGVAFAAGFLSWLLPALMADTANAGVLSARVGQLFMGLAAWQLLLLTGLLGGLLTGPAWLTGLWGRGLSGK